LLLLAPVASNAGPSANRTREGSGLLNALIFGDSHHQQDASSRATTGAPSKPRTDKINTSAQTTNAQTRSGIYDGVWSSSGGRTLLIKQIHRTLYVSGSSAHAAWQSQCVMSNASARCLGDGISDTAGAFHYESTLRLGGAGLQSDWLYNYSSGHRQSGRAAFSIVPH